MCTGRRRPYPPCRVVIAQRSGEHDDRVPVDLRWIVDAPMPGNIGPACINRPWRICDLSTDQRTFVRPLCSDCDVGFTSAKLENSVAHDKFNPHVGIARIKFLDKTCADQPRSERFRAGDLHRSPCLICLSGNRAFEIGYGSLNPSRICLNVLAQFGKPVSGRTTSHELTAKLSFQLLNPAVYRRLIDAQHLAADSVLPERATARKYLRSFQSNMHAVMHF